MARDIRQASTSDVEAVAELRAAVLRADLERLGRYDEQRVRQRLRDGFDPAHTWVIEVAGMFAGCVALRPAEDAHWLGYAFRFTTAAQRQRLRRGAGRGAVTSGTAGIVPSVP